VQKCREVLSVNGEQYTDKEIEEIRILIITPEEVDYFHFKKWMETEKEEQEQDIKIISIYKDENNSNEFKKTG